MLYLLDPVHLQVIWSWTKAGTSSILLQKIACIYMLILLVFMLWADCCISFHYHQCSESLFVVEECLFSTKKKGKCLNWIKVDVIKRSCSVMIIHPSFAQAQRLFWILALIFGVSHPAKPRTGSALLSMVPFRLLSWTSNSTLVIQT